MARQKLPQHKDDCIDCKLPEPNGLYHACMNCRNKAVAECRRLEAELERAMAKADMGENNALLPDVSFSEEWAEVREYAQWKSCKYEGCSRAVSGVDYCFEHEHT